VIVLFRFDRSQEEAQTFLTEAQAVLASLRNRTGYIRGWIARAADEPQLWVLGTEWTGAGAYRRAMADAEVRAQAAIFLGTARNEASAFEVVVADADGVGR
jgi:quinol monooxygenase YgiN